MKKQILAAVLAVSTATTLTLPMAAQASGVPVFDVSNFTGQLKQLFEAKRQFEQAQASFNQFRGSRDIGVLFNQYGKYLPTEMQGMYKDYQTGNWAGLSDKVAQLENSQRLNGTQKQILQQMADKERSATYGNKVKLDDMFAKSNQRFAQIERMANSIDLQNDPKAAADLLNRIQVENAMLQLQTNQLQMVGMLREAELQVQRQQRIDRARRFNSTGGGKKMHVWR